MQYKILSADSADELAAKVKHELAAGWQLQGGVSVSGWLGVTWENERKGTVDGETCYAFAQAMTRLAWSER